MDAAVEKLIERYRKSKYPQSPRLTGEERKKFAGVDLETLRDRLYSQNPEATNMVSLNSDTGKLVFSDGQNFVAVKIEELGYCLRGKGDGAHYEEKRLLSKRERKMRMGQSRDSPVV